MADWSISAPCSSRLAGRTWIYLLLLFSPSVPLVPSPLPSKDTKPLLCSVCEGKLQIH